MRNTEKSEVAPWSIPLQRTRDRALGSISPKTEDPIAVYYFPGGWNYGHPTFHVIIEYGDMEQTDYQFMSLDQMVKAFGLSPDEVSQVTSCVVTADDAKKHPNDQDLGKFVRNTLYK